MTFRISTQSTFNRFLLGLQDARYRAALAQEQLTSGLRINRPSDDPSGAARSLSLSQHLATVGGYAATVGAGRNQLDAASAGLLNASDLVAEGRAILVQALNGTLTAGDRRSLAVEFEILRDQLLEIANQSLGERHLFGGTLTDAPPWETVDANGRVRVVYRGNDELQRVRVGDGLDVAINLPGADVFGGGRPAGTSLTGATGLRAGLTADEGSGHETLTLRHDATDAGSLASVGITLVSGGASDTLLGVHGLDIDALAGTIRLGDGPLTSLPAAGSAERADFVVRNEAGGELHLDLSGYSGADYAGTVQGQGSISIDGSTFVPLSFAETDLELTNAASGSTVHVDTTAVAKAGQELVTFSGALNLFDLLQGIEEDLRTITDPADLFPRLEAHLAELDQGHERLISATSALGARSQRLGVSGERAADLGVQLAGLLSSTQDADIAAVALDLAKADASLQLAQSAGSRLLQTTLLNFLS